MPSILKSKIFFAILFFASLFLFAGKLSSVNAQTCRPDVQVRVIDGCRKVVPDPTKPNEGYCAENWHNETIDCVASTCRSVSYNLHRCSSFAEGCQRLDRVVTTACSTYTNITPTPTPVGSGGGTGSACPAGQQVLWYSPPQYFCPNPGSCDSSTGPVRFKSPEQVCGTTINGNDKLTCEKGYCGVIGIPTQINPRGTLTCPSSSPSPVTFSWTAAAGATSYYLRIDDLSNGWVNCGTGSSNPGDYCISGITGLSRAVNLPASKSYKWWVSAYNGTTPGALSPMLAFNIPAVCSGGTASCQNISAYTALWAPMSMTQLSQQRPGDKLYYCANGAASTGYFEKVRFKVNGVLSPESTLVRPGSANPRDFCALFTVPSGVTNFNVVAELYHVTLGWVR